MRVCAFGTIRMDIHVYQNLNKIDEKKEIKIKEMSINLGGSVYNTASVLNELGQDIVLYSLRVGSDFSGYIKQQLKKNKLKYVWGGEDRNNLTTSILFIDNMGEKKVISYDGDRRDKDILQILKNEIEQYELFYTSFYEINKSNYRNIESIMSSSVLSFVDLSPLIYEIDAEIIECILNRTDMLSGTKEEYEMLFNTLQSVSYGELLQKYRIKYLFVKRGEEGATVLSENMDFSCEPREKKISHDTTGCGDTFNAIIIEGLSKDNNIKEILENAVEMATKVAYDGFCLEMFRNNK